MFGWGIIKTSLFTHLYNKNGKNIYLYNGLVNTQIIDDKFYIISSKYFTFD